MALIDGDLITVLDPPLTPNVVPPEATSLEDLRSAVENS